MSKEAIIIDICEEPWKSCFKLICKAMEMAVYKECYLAEDAGDLWTNAIALLAVIKEYDGSQAADMKLNCLKSALSGLCGKDDVSDSIDSDDNGVVECEMVAYAKQDLMSTGNQCEGFKINARC